MPIKDPKFGAGAANGVEGERVLRHPQLSDRAAKEGRRRMAPRAAGSQPRIFDSVNAMKLMPERFHTSEDLEKVEQRRYVSL